MKTLKDVKVGETATVAKLHGEGPVKRRIMDMGITKGVEIYVRKVAPLGDPMELTVRLRPAADPPPPRHRFPAGCLCAFTGKAGQRQQPCGLLYVPRRHQ